MSSSLSQSLLDLLTTPQDTSTPPPPPLERQTAQEQPEAKVKKARKPRIKKPKPEQINVVVPKPEASTLIGLAHALVNDQAKGLLPLSQVVLDKANEHFFQLMSACQKKMIVSPEALEFAKHVELLRAAIEHVK